MKSICITILALALFLPSHSQKANPVKKPLFTDPIYDGAADPVIIYNKQKKAWWMFYNNGGITCDRTKPVTIRLTAK